MVGLVWIGNLNIHESLTCTFNYIQISNISRTRSQNWNVSRLVLTLSMCNLWKPGVKSKMKMPLGQRRQAVLQLHLSDQQFYCPLRCDLYKSFDGIISIDNTRHISLRLLSKLCWCMHIYSISVHLRKYVHGSCFVVFCWGLAHIDFTQNI